jgi:hypothetical protein
MIENVEFPEERELNAEELKAKTEEMINFYKEQIDFMKVQLEFESLSADIEENRLKRMVALIRQAQLNTPPSNEEDEGPKEERPKKNLKKV